MNSNTKTRGVTPEKTQAMLAEMGITISTAKAALVLDFMYKMAKLEVDDLMKEKWKK